MSEGSNAGVQKPLAVVDGFRIFKNHVLLCRKISDLQRTELLAKHLGISQRAVYKLLDTLEKHGFIEKRHPKKREYILTGTGAKLALMEVNGGSISSKIPPIRLHNVWAKARIRRLSDMGPMEPEEIRRHMKQLEKEQLFKTSVVKCKPVRMKGNWEQRFIEMVNVGLIRTTSKNIMIKLPIIWAYTMEEAKNEIIEALHDHVRQIEKTLGITILVPNRLTFSLSSQHIAFQEEKIVEYLRETLGMKTHKIKDSNGETRVIIDNSKDEESNVRCKEIEFVHPFHGEEDAKTWERMRKIEKLDSFVIGMCEGSVNPFETARLAKMSLLENYETKRNLSSLTEKLNEISNIFAGFFKLLSLQDIQFKRKGPKNEDISYIG